MSHPTESPTPLRPAVAVWLVTLRSIALGALAWAVADALGFPAPALTGPALLMSVLGLAGLKLDIAVTVRNCAFLAIGVTMGTGVTPEVIETVRQWPAGFVILAAAMVVTVVAGTALLHRLWRFDRETALLAAMPGHLSYVLGLSAERHADLAVIGVVQSIRLLALTLIVPFAVVWANGDGGAMPVQAGNEMSATVLVATIVLSAALGWVLHRFAVPAALLLGGMVVSTIGHLGGWTEGQMPIWLALPAFVVLGTLIGTRFSGITLAMLARSAVAGIAATVLASAICLAATLAASLFVDAPFSQILIAFAPGGVETMAAMALMMDVDATYVAAHHIWRLLILTFLAPISIAWIARGQGGRGRSDTPPTP